MLEIKNIKKVYETEGFKQTALDNVSVNFRENEFASILGPSGSGKTTFLNVIGGLDKYDSGDLVINEVSTKKFKESDWDSYRNHRIGFVFQSYNLISHQTILANVKLALTLSGISKKDAINMAKKALKDVGLEKHMNKRPNQLSGGQMQRVAIARALVNNPDILLADEPTGALDSETSVQIMKLLKKIAKEKLVIMVTHNPELAKEYSTRIITLKDGKITSDSNPYDGNINTKKSKEDNNIKSKKTSMSFKTALGLSLNNLLTKKARTILVSIAGSIGIIGIALILAVSTGFQNYVDSIQEDALTSYPLSIMKESTDIAGTILSMTAQKSENDNSNTVKEQQYISSVLANIKSNDLKSFNNYLKRNYDSIKSDISNIKYSYSIDPLIYTYDVDNNLAKLNPSNLFSSFTGSSMMSSSFSSMASIFSQMIDNKEIIKEQYDVLYGRLPKKYNEVIIVLSEPNSISDLLIYSLGLRNSNELSEIVMDIMSGKQVSVNNEPLEFTYDDLLNVSLKMILPSDVYSYNNKYDVYEDMSSDMEYMKTIYDNGVDLKVVGILSPKAGTTTLALNPGVNYSSELIKYIIDESSKSEIVQKQLNNVDIDVFSGKRFDVSNNAFDYSFSDLVNIDTNKLKNLFSIDENVIKNETENYMNDISNSISIDTNIAKDTYHNVLEFLIKDCFESISNTIALGSVDGFIDLYLESEKVANKLSTLEKDFVIPAQTYKVTYNSILKGFMSLYINQYYLLDNTLTTSIDNPVAGKNEQLMLSLKEMYLGSAEMTAVEINMSKIMTEAVIKKNVLVKVSEMTNNLINTLAKSYNMSPDLIASAFSLNFTEDEFMRVASTLTNKTEKNSFTNLISLGYQDIDDPTYISFYFNSFEGKENFLGLIDNYNEIMENQGNEDNVINYTDTTGILMSSVKTIVNAVSYVLIAFVSISLVVSSIMIGVITYISVYERTKEIGILRSIGASKRNISSIFNAETFIIGLLSGIFGIVISYLLIPIINLILHHYTGNIPLAAKLNIKHALILVLLSILLTIIGGLIPAKSASKKDPVEALRSE